MGVQFTVDTAIPIATLAYLGNPGLDVAWRKLRSRLSASPKNKISLPHKHVQRENERRESVKSEWRKRFGNYQNFRQLRSVRSGRLAKNVRQR